MHYYVQYTMFSTVCGFAIHIVMSIIVAVEVIRFIVCTGQVSEGGLASLPQWCICNKARLWNTLQFNDIQCNLMKYNAIQYNDWIPRHWNNSEYWSYYHRMIQLNCKAQCGNWRKSKPRCGWWLKASRGNYGWINKTIKVWPRFSWMVVWTKTALLWMGTEFTQEYSTSLVSKQYMSAP